MIERNVKVFISSTFKDMHTERDYLINHVFPGIKRKALDLGIHLLDIDLRWGITEEEALNGKTLGICLDEVENARPFFIGLVGNRYGWIPSVLDESAKEYIDGLDSSKNNFSITHLEILYGVLQTKDMNKRSFFFKRKIKEIDSLPDCIKQMLLDEDINSVKLLEGLEKDINDYYGDLSKDQIFYYEPDFYGIKFNLEQVKNVLPLEFTKEEMLIISAYLNEDFVIPKEDFSKLPLALIVKLSKIGVAYLKNLEAFGDIVSQVIYEGLVSEYGLKREKEESDEEKVHRAFLRDRIHNFSGREDLIVKILNSAKENKITFIEGDVGSGKSSLMGKVASILELNQQVFFVFCGLSEASSSIKGVLSILIDQISKHYSIKGLDNKNRSYEEDIELLFNLLLTINFKEKIYFFIDALDQLLPIDNPELFKWLPKDVDNIHFICSTNKGVFIDQAKYFHFPIISVQPLSYQESKEIILSYLLIFRKSLSQEQLTSLLSKKAVDNPLYLTTAIDLIRTFPKYEEIDQLIFDLPFDVFEIFQFFIDDLLIHHPSAFVKDILSWLFLARYGIMESDLLMLYELKYQKQCPRLIWIKLYQRIAFYLTNLSENKQGLLTPFHQVFSKAIEIKFLSDLDYRVEQTKYLALLANIQFNSRSMYLSNLSQFLGSYLFEAREYSMLIEVISTISKYDLRRSQHVIIENLMTDCALSEDKAIYQDLGDVLTKLKSVGNMYNIIYILLSEFNRIAMRGLTAFSYFLAKMVLSYSEDYRGKDEKIIGLLVNLEMAKISFEISGLEVEAKKYCEKAIEIFDNLSFFSRLGFSYGNKDSLYMFLTELHLSNNQIDKANEYLVRTKNYHNKSFTFKNLGKINILKYYNVFVYLLKQSGSLKKEKVIQKTIGRIKRTLKKEPNNIELFLNYLDLEFKLLFYEQNPEEYILKCKSIYSHTLAVAAKAPYNQIIKLKIVEVLSSLIFKLLIIGYIEDSKVYLDALDEVTYKLTKLDNLNKRFKLARCDYLKLLGDYCQRTQNNDLMLELQKQAFFLWFDAYQYHFIANDVADLILQYGINYLNALNTNSSYQEVIDTSEKIIRKVQETEYSKVLLTDVLYQKAVAYFKLSNFQDYYDMIFTVINSYEELITRQLVNASAVGKYFSYLSRFIEFSIENQEYNLTFVLFYKQISISYNNETDVYYLTSVEESLNQIKTYWLRDFLVECNPLDVVPFLKKLVRFINYRLFRPRKAFLEKVMYIISTLYDIFEKHDFSVLEHNYIQANLLRLSSYLMELEGENYQEIEDTMKKALGLYKANILTDFSLQLKEEIFIVYAFLRRISINYQTDEYLYIMNQIALELSDNQYSSYIVKEWVRNHLIKSKKKKNF